MKKEDKKKTVVLIDKSSENIKGLGFKLSNNPIFKNIREQAESLSKIYNNPLLKSIRKQNKAINNMIAPLRKQNEVITSAITPINNFSNIIKKEDLEDYFRPKTVMFVPPINYEAENNKLLSKISDKLDNKENFSNIFLGEEKEEINPKKDNIEYITPINKNGLIFIFDNLENLLFSLTPLQTKIFNILKSKNKDGGISLKNIKEITKQPTENATHQSIKEIRTIIKRKELKKYINIYSRNGFYKMDIKSSKKGSF